MQTIAFFSFMLVIVAFFVTIFLFVKRYKRVPPNRFMVVFGRGRDITGAEVITSGAKMIWPVIREVYQGGCNQPIYVMEDNGNQTKIAFSLIGLRFFHERRLQFPKRLGLLSFLGFLDRTEVG